MDVETQIEMENALWEAGHAAGYASALHDVAKDMAGPGWEEGYSTGHAAGLRDAQIVVKVGGPKTLALLVGRAANRKIRQTGVDKPTDR